MDSEGDTQQDAEVCTSRHVGGVVYVAKYLRNDATSVLAMRSKCLVVVRYSRSTTIVGVASGILYRARSMDVAVFLQCGCPFHA